VIFVRCRTVAKVDSIVIWSQQDDQACELLFCVMNGVGDVAVRTFGSATKLVGSACRVVVGGGRDSPLAEGLGESIAEPSVVVLQLADALCGDLDAA